MLNLVLKYGLHVLLLITLCFCNQQNNSSDKKEAAASKSAVIIVENMKFQIITNAFDSVVSKLNLNGVKLLKVIDISDNKDLIIPALKEAVSLKPDIICIYQTGKIEAALNKNKAQLQFLEIPVVMSNFLKSEKIHPKITGLTFLVSAVSILKLWKKILPNAKKVSIIGSVNNDYSIYMMNDFEKQAKKFGYQIKKIYKIKYGYEWKKAILENNRSDVDFTIFGLWLDLKMRNGQTQVSNEYDEMRYWIVRNNLKGVGAAVNSSVLRGLTFGICTDDEIAIGKEIGDLMLKILNGKKVEEIPIETPASLYLSFNIKHAKKIGLTIPYEILNEAKYIYDKFVGEYDDDFFDKYTAKARQPKHPENWDWNPK